MFDLFNTRDGDAPADLPGANISAQGGATILDFFGIVFGHIYHHCKTIGVLCAPDSLITWYKLDSEWATRIRGLYTPISSDFEMVE
jgi:hypothetical protein